MEYSIYKIVPDMSYVITIGSRDKPDSEFREKVQRDIDRAMGAFSRERGASHSLAILTDPNFDNSPEDLPTTEIFPGGQYLIFALIYSNPHDPAESREDLGENRAELERAFERIIGEDNINDINIGLVLLRDCSIKLFTLFAPSSPEFYKGWIKGHPEGNQWIKR